MADAAAELEEGGIKRTLKDLFAGAAGGIAQVLLGESGVKFNCHLVFDHVASVKESSTEGFHFHIKQAGDLFMSVESVAALDLGFWMSLFLS